MRSRPNIPRTAASIPSATKPSPSIAQLAEDQSLILSDAKVNELFHGLDFVRVDDRAGAGNSLMNEVWRMFLVAMMAAMIVEAALCLPKLRRATPALSTTAELNECLQRNIETKPRITQVNTDHKKLHRFQAT